MNSKIDSSMYLSNQPKHRTPSSDLGKDEFIKILMTQLQNQDPLNPMQDQEFIAQMAQFSSLEQMMNMASSIDSLVQNQLVSPVIQYSQMIGREVTYTKEDDESGQKEQVTSEVVAVSQKDGWAILELKNGEKVYADSVEKVEQVTGDKDE